MKIKAIRPKCGIEGCLVKHYSKGYCRPHYARLWNSLLGNPDMNPVISKSNNVRIKKKCSHKKCLNPHYAKNLCQSHYILVRAVKIAIADERKCDVIDCKFIHSSKGLCKIHYDLLQLNANAAHIKNESDYDPEVA